MHYLFLQRLKFFVILLLIAPASVLAFDYLQPLPPVPLIPADNPLTDAKIMLGKKLFFDTTILGPDSQISCNSCHNLANGGDDDQALSKGQNGKISKRSAPSLWNIGFQTVLYWDGRATSLEAQTLDHLRDPIIVNWPNIGAIVSRLNQSDDYRQHFAQVFGYKNSISGVNLARALASFERSLLATNSPFDQYLRGDKSAISASAKRGIQAFNNAGCLACHFGVNFAGPAPGPAMKMGDGFYELFPNNLGSRFETQYHLAEDLGRYEFTGDPGERHMWRVPPLRNIAITAPYFHNGSVSSLHEAIRVMAKTQFGKELSDNDINDIEAFLNSLTGELLTDERKDISDNK